jgi:hypothetical protein
MQILLVSARKFVIKQEYYDLRSINGIIRNHPTHLVAIFKDYLIYDDLTELLECSYAAK